jgi:zinc protease
MNESTQETVRKHSTNMLEQLGSTVTFSSADEYTIVQINCLKSHMDQTMSIVKEKLFYPLFDSAEFVRVKKTTFGTYWKPHESADIDS